MEVVLCLSTCPDRGSALGLARVLVEERLAACVSVLPGVTSLYRWQGSIEQNDELQLLIKTTRTNLPALKARLSELHPHEVPELIVLEVVDGLPAYLAWVDATARACGSSGAPE